jgi:hypothetical protein
LKVGWFFPFFLNCTAPTFQKIDFISTDYDRTHDKQSPSRNFIPPSILTPPAKRSLTYPSNEDELESGNESRNAKICKELLLIHSYSHTYSENRIRYTSHTGFSPCFPEKYPERYPNLTHIFSSLQPHLQISSKCCVWQKRRMRKAKVLRSVVRKLPKNNCNRIKFV